MSEQRNCRFADNGFCNRNCDASEVCAVFVNKHQIKTRVDRLVGEDCPVANNGLCNHACGDLCSLALRAEGIGAPAPEPKHSHYFKACPFGSVDVYRVLALFDVTDPCIQHAVKKLLVAGGRGHKDIAKDIQDSIDTLERWKAMREEESA